MNAHDQEPPTVGTHVEMLRPGAFIAGSFERATVVDRLTDYTFGVVLEIEFEDAVRVQRVWPSPAIRLLKLGREAAPGEAGNTPPGRAPPGPVEPYVVESRSPSGSRALTTPRS
jgi:hypothetical protein